MSQAMQKFRSEGLIWTSGGTKNLPLDFLPRTGKRGGRLVIDKLFIQGDFVLTTAATTTLDGPSGSSLLRRLRIYDSVGDRRRLTGWKTRIKSYLDLRDSAPSDPVTFPISQTAQPYTYIWCVLLTPKEQMAHRETDYGMPVDDLARGGIELSFPAVTDVLWTGALGVTAIVSGVYTIFAECHEEHDIQFKVRDVVMEYTTDNNTDLKLPVSGKLVREVVLLKDLAGGGAVVTTVVDVTMEPYNWASYPRRPIKEGYLNLGNVDANDPVQNDFCLPVIHPYLNQPIPDMLLIPNTLLIRVNSTMVTPDLMAHFIAPKDEEQMRATLVRNGLSANHPVKVKTMGKSKEAPEAWGAYAAFMPGKAA